MARKNDLVKGMKVWASLNGYRRPATVVDFDNWPRIKIRLPSNNYRTVNVDVLQPRREPHESDPVGGRWHIKRKLTPRVPPKPPKN